MAGPDEKGEESKAKRAAVQRSPSYPSLDLKTAIDRARQFYDAEKRSSANVKIAAGHWGYQITSSGGKQTIAALLAYGLMEDEGNRESRTVRLTDLAFRILLDDREVSADRDEAIKRAARMPKIHQEILQKWPEMPSDANLKHYLLIDRKFNENTVSEFIRNLRATIAFAKLDGKPTGSPPSSDKTETGDQEKINPQVDVGDLIQWESAGEIRLDSPKRVRAIQEHDGAKWVFVDGSETGIPMNETVIERKAEKAQSAPPTLPIAEPDSRLHKGEREWLRGPLSKETGYRLIINGEIGPKEIAKLIKLLEAQKDVLDEDD